MAYRGSCDSVVPKHREPHSQRGTSTTGFGAVRPFRFCPWVGFILVCESYGDALSETDQQSMNNTGEPKTFAKPKKSGWWGGAMAHRLAGAAVSVFRGCWHEKMSWPVGVQGYSYQVCLGCGAKRLFDETTFSAYGPFRYDLQELAAWGECESQSASMRDVQGEVRGEVREAVQQPPS
jgi:hypothetical protein